MKSIVILLLLLLFFMSGMMFGANRTENTSPEGYANKPEVEQVDAVVETSTVKVNQAPDRIEKVAYRSDSSSHFTQDAASFIGGIVTGFYEVVVQMLYQVVQLFY